MTPSSPDLVVCCLLLSISSIGSLAAGEGELALDLDYKAGKQFPTLDGMPHGALTDAILRVITNKIPADHDHNGKLTHQELITTVLP